MPLKGAKSRRAKANMAAGHATFTKNSREASESGSEDGSGYASEAELLRDAADTLAHHLGEARTEALPPSKKRKTGLRTVYTGESSTTKWRKAKKEKEREADAKEYKKITSFFSKKADSHTVQLPDIDFTPDIPEVPEVLEWEDVDNVFAGVSELMEEAADWSEDLSDPDECDGEVEDPGLEVLGRAELSDEIVSASEEEARECGPELEFPEPRTLPIAAQDDLLDEGNEDEVDDVLEIVKKNLRELRRLPATGAVMRNLTHLTAIAEYVKRRGELEKNPRCQKPWLVASMKVAAQMGKGPFFARTVRFNTIYITKHKKLPPYNRGRRGRHASWLDNEAVLQKVKVYLASQQLGEIKPNKLRKFITQDVLPTLSQTIGLSTKIALSTVHRWLRKLGYTRHSSKKGVYIDGHERPDVVESRNKFLEDIATYEKLMCPYDEKTMEPLPRASETGEREHILIVQDESIFHVNDQQREMWLTGGQMPLRQKGNGRSIHVSDFLCEKSGTGRLALSSEQLTDHTRLPEDQQLKVTDCRKIIYPGKNADKWWDMPQLLAQTEDAVDIFEYLHPGAAGVFLFDCSAAHEAFAPDALNVNNMNVKPGRKQSKLRDTIIPANNPPPRPGQPNTRGQKQTLVYPADHALAGQAKGILEVLKERATVWDKLVEELGGKKVVGTCKECKLSQKKKEALARIAKAEDSGHNEQPSAEDVALVEKVVPESRNNWCCTKRVLSLQQDFIDEKPMLQTYIEGRGHVCLFLPKFHCELNAIELYWGFAKYRYRDVNDGKFGTAKKLVPQCLDLCSPITIRRFFRKCWRYMDSYRKGLNFLLATRAVKKYKSHRRIPDSAEVRAALQQLSK